MVKTRQQKREVAEDTKKAAPSPKRRRGGGAKCAANQPLVDALHELSAALFRAQVVDAKNRFRGVAIRRAANALAELDYGITSGSPLAEGPHKVPGVGKGTAAYCDEFLETGEIYETRKYNELADRAQKTEVKAALASKAEQKEGSKGEGDEVKINRAPVLTLWVVVVAERQGFTRDEAYTYGRWVSGVLAQSKGRSLGIYEAKEQSEEERAAKKRRDESMGVQHVEAFGHMKIPTVEQDGSRLAVSGGKALDPSSVKGYLLRAFGDKLDEVEAAMTELAESMPEEELRKRAYHLYESFRPTWKGWGQKSTLKLSSIRELAEQNHDE